MLYTYMITGAGAADDVVDRVVRALDAGVDRIQIRRKSDAATAVETMIGAILAERTSARNKLIVNDRLDVAIALGIAGVHLPADGFRPGAARRVAPSHFEIGVSVHDVDAALRAERDGADYVVFGPVFQTASKPGHPGVGLGRLREVVASVSIPVYGLGGMVAERLAGVAATGAYGVAGIAAFENDETLEELLSCR